MYSIVMPVQLDGLNTSLADALIAQFWQPLPNLLRQGGSGNIEAQMHRIRHLVDVLPPGPLGADDREFNFFGRDGDYGSNGKKSGFNEPRV